MKKKVDPKNRLNDLDSSRWLQFQKSWFLLENTALSLTEFIAFFTKKIYPDGREGTICLAPDNLAEQLQQDRQNARVVRHRAELDAHTLLDYAMYDARSLADAGDDEQAWRQAIDEIRQLSHALREDAYLTVIVKNKRHATATDPVAWKLAQRIRESMIQKDEKIGCLKNGEAQSSKQAPWVPDDSILYFLNFRKQNSPTAGEQSNVQIAAWRQPQPASQSAFYKNGFAESWYVRRPPRRDKNVLLHPAKFPEDLVQKYITTFTEPGEWVFDPMAGTGSALVAALGCERKAGAIELNPEFVDIAKSRLPKSESAILITGDAASETSYQHLPEPFDYCITSPPYWDMLRMRGAETQAKRKKQGLQRWYSEDERDLGNVADYQQFLDLLQGVYERVAKHLRPGRYMTIIVKNIKKQGTIYPLAWDIVERLSPFLIFAGEQFWCQDDQRLAPFGYRYVWVSNTFHHYCLTFRKPA